MKRTRTMVGIAAALFALAVSVLWVVGREAGQPGTIRAQGSSRGFLSSWPPAARGVLWLGAGAAAVGFDLLVVRAHAESRRGKDVAAAFAVVTGVAFTIFAFATFTEQI